LLPFLRLLDKALYIVRYLITLSYFSISTLIWGKSKWRIGQCMVSKPGGLDSQDQSRLKHLNLLRLVLKTCQNFLECQNTICFCLSQDFLNWDFWMEILLHQDFYWDCRDCWDKSKFFEIWWDFQDLLRYLDKFRNLDWEKW
jgi:hypothetical protein